MKNRRLYGGILASAVHFLICIFSGALGWNIQTIIVPIISILAIFVSNRLFGIRLLVSFLTVAPFFILYTGVGLLTNASPLTKPIWMFGLLTSGMTLFFLKWKVRPSISISLLVLTILFDGLFAWPNIFANYTTENELRYKDITESRIVDVTEKEIPVQSFKGKVVLFDLWHSACGICFKKFPDLQRLYDNYKDDSLVKIISLNMPLEKDHGARPVKYTKKYSFDKMYFLDQSEYEKLSIRGTPLVLIVDKNGHCRYAGQLNTGWNIFIGNVKRIINRLKNEDN